MDKNTGLVASGEEVLLFSEAVNRAFSIRGTIRLSKT